MSAAGTTTDTPPGAGAPVPAAPDHDLRAVLAIRPFRALWACLGLSSLGDWLGLLATTAMARSLGGDYASANLAVSAVLFLRLAPAILLGPLAGAIADRWDRKTTMVVGDLLRGVLFVSIPLVGSLWWLFVATLLIEVVALFWGPAKDASVPNLVPRERLEAANQVSLAVTYGTAPVAALLFSALTALSGGVFSGALGGTGGGTDLALYLNAATYFVAAATIARLRVPNPERAAAPGAKAPTLVGTIVEGWRYVSGTPLIRGLVLGMLGAFAAGGFVIGVAPSFVVDLGAGDPGYGLLFGAVFTGLALGMWRGPRVLGALPRWRLFALAIVAAGVALLGLALIPNIVIVAALALVVGACGGVAWVTGWTMLGLEVADELRGRTFAFVQSSARVVLVAVMALAPVVAAVVGEHRFDLTEDAGIDYNGAAFTLVLASVVAVSIGLVAYRQMDDGRSGPLHSDLRASWSRRRRVRRPVAVSTRPGLFIAVEGGDGVGKSTQVGLLQQWLQAQGHDVLVTREPGATELGASIRQLLLHGDDVSPRAEALLYAADRAHHVDRVVLPALRAGRVVVTDRYIDSSVAYQGAGRALDADEVASVSYWATGDLLPDITVLLDADPEHGLRRSARRRGGLDRIEREPLEFHRAVRQAFLHLARADRHRYLRVDAQGSAEEVAAAVREQVAARIAVLRGADRDGVGAGEDAGAAAPGAATPGAADAAATTAVGAAVPPGDATATSRSAGASPPTAASGGAAASGGTTAPADGPPAVVDPRATTTAVSAAVRPLPGRDRDVASWEGTETAPVTTAPSGARAAAPGYGADEGWADEGWSDGDGDGVAPDGADRARGERDGAPRDRAPRDGAPRDGVDAADDGWGGRGDGAGGPGAGRGGRR